MIGDLISIVARHELDLRYGSATDTDGNSHKYPYIKCSSRTHAKKVSDILDSAKIKNEIDLYEDDDGDDGDGRPIIRKLWSVRMPDIWI
jgi:hypothetical protein